jgi:hypothetical protein
MRGGGYGMGKNHIAGFGNVPAADCRGRHPRFDPKSESFVGDSEADPMRRRNGRKPYAIPGTM